MKKVESKSRRQRLRALVTGAGGFVGQHLCRLLVEREIAVYGTTHPADPTKTARPVSGCRYRPCDVGDFASVRDALQWARPDWIVHLAAVSFPRDATWHPEEAWRTNFLGTMNLYEAVRVSRSRPRILFVGSSEEYGAPPPERFPIDETCPLLPTGVYGCSKAAADMAGAFFMERHGLDLVRVRPFNHTGPGQSPRFVCSSFARQVAEAALRPGHKRMILVGNLDAQRDFLDVRDVARAYVLALERCPAGEVFNIASGRAVRLGDILDKLVFLARVETKIGRDPERLRAVEAPRLVGDATKFHLATGWRPEIPLQDTLWDLLEYWRTQLASVEKER